ncbi:hypothetical protein MBANPS3_003515 [Mucor bainieri]
MSTSAIDDNQSTSSVSVNDSDYNEIICPALLRARDGQTVNVNKVIVDLKTIIVDSYSTEKKLDDFKGDWVGRIARCASLLKLTLSGTPSFKPVDRELQSSNEAASSSSARVSESAFKIPMSPASSALSTSSTTTTPSYSLKEPFTYSLRQCFIQSFNNMDKRKFWYLKSSTRDKEGSVLSVEERLYHWGLDCHYLHPMHSFIIDLGDDNLNDIFSEEELLEMQEDGGLPFTLTPPSDIKTQLDFLRTMTSMIEIHNHYRKLDYHPLEDRMLAWLCTSIAQTSSDFFMPGILPTTSEHDNMVNHWNFLNTICRYTSINAISKEKSSESNSIASNSKRRLSSTEEITRKAMGRKMDTIYIGGNCELGALEIGLKNDSTKNFPDGYMKLPMVMRDMLCHIVSKHPTLKSQVSITGYNIQGDSISYMAMDSPSGFVTRIRRLQDLPYPTSKDDYAARIPALLEVAYTGFMSMSNTLDRIHQCSSQLVPLIGRQSQLPPTLRPSRKAKSAKTTTSSPSSQ